MTAQHYLACDLGAESGRVMLATLKDGRVALEQIHRFPNRPVRLGGSLRWDALRLFDELKAGLRLAGARGLPVASLSVDAWGVDYALHNAVHPLLSPPFHYRDPRTDATYGPVRQAVGEAAIFAETGIQFMPINTLYQLADDLARSRALLDTAEGFLLIGDYLNFLFSGIACVEESSASTTQLYNPRARAWSDVLIGKTGLPARLFPRVVPSGTVLGPLLPELAEETGLSGVQVVAGCSHDTGAAVAAVPAEEGEHWAYLSSGTWSLLGVELPAPLINEAVRARNFTNETGCGGTVRFLKNLVGLWLLQEARVAWAQTGQEIAYATLNLHAEEAPAFRSLLRADDPRFARPGGMPEKIAAYCRETRQPAPETPGQFARCILESLALLYRSTLAEIEELTGRTVTHLHIVGGGSQSRLLNQFAASATGREVLAGPVEATALGNALVQAHALGHLGSLAELRATVRRSFPLQTFQPQDAPGWHAAAARFASLPLAV